MKKVLIITYYWPPSGGGGVQRWLKFTKYLREFGWEPVIYTHSNGEVPVIDHSLENEIPQDIEVIKRPIWEPFSIYKKLTGQKSSEKVQTGFLSEGKKPGLMQKIATWIRGNFFIPDARCFWIKPSARYLDKEIKRIAPDVIVTTGPPHSMHLIAEKLRQKHNIPWIADFRDPWTNIDFYPRLMLTSIADKIHRKLEAKVLKKADQVLTVSKNWALDFKNLGAGNVEVITNGFDPDDFPEETPSPESYFSLTHAGYLNEDRNPVKLWDTLGQLVKKDEKFNQALKIRFIGKTDRSVFESLKYHGLENHIENIDYLPHQEAIELCCRSQILLLLLSDTPEARGRIPGKLFEYLATKRPVFCIGPEDGDSARIIRETQSGYIASFHSSETIEKNILRAFQEFNSGEISIKPEGIEKYKRKQLTGELSKVLNNIAQKTV